MAFAGYLLKAVDTNEVFPNQYIEYESWTSTPDRREELVAYRDDNTRNLVRVTAAGKKSTFSFNLRDGLHLKDKQKIQSFFTRAEVDTDQRKVQLEFWNDETNSYDTGFFYRPNMPFPIKSITENDIVYGKLSLEFIEY